MAMNTRTADFIILGGGMAGMSLAANLPANARVVLIERELHPGYHATGRSAALFSETYGGPAVRALTRASRAFLEAPPSGFSDAALLSPRGTAYIAREDQLDRLAAFVDARRTTGSDVVDLSAAQIRERVPVLRDGYIARAALEPGAMDMDANAILQGFRRMAKRQGMVEVLDAGSPAVERASGVWRITVRDGVVEAPVLVNAAGAWADEVAVAAGAGPIGLTPLSRSAALIDAPPGLDIKSWPMVIDIDETFYFKPDARKLLLSPANETPSPPHDAFADDMQIAEAVERMQAAADIEVRRISHSWAGLRTFAVDREPVVGFDRKVEGFFWLAGQGGYGIQAAEGLARTAAALATGRPIPADILEEGLDPAAISPARAALQMVSS
jgi:D-arginine dehydrogenase